MFSNKDIFDIVCNGYNKKLFKNLTGNEARKYSSGKLSTEMSSTRASEIVDIFFKSFRSKWKGCCRKKNRLMKNHEDWLKKDINDNEVSTSQLPIKKVGRKNVAFTVASEKTKIRRSDELRESKSTEELLHSAFLALKKDGRTEDAKVVKQILDSGKKSSNLIKRIRSFTAEKALGMILDCGLSKADYQTLRSEAFKLSSTRSDCIYPTYNAVRKAKQDCLPKRAIIVSDYCAELDLQSLMDHTTERIFQLLNEEKVSSLESNTRLKMIHKVGFDGSLGQSVYKQFTTETERNLL